LVKKGANVNYMINEQTDLLITAYKMQNVEMLEFLDKNHSEEHLFKMTYPQFKGQVVREAIYFLKDLKAKGEDGKKKGYGGSLPPP
jgi:hypothetical protein